MLKKHIATQELVNTFLQKLEERKKNRQWQRRKVDLCKPRL